MAVSTFSAMTHCNTEAPLAVRIAEMRKSLDGREGVKCPRAPPHEISVVATPLQEAKSGYLRSLLV